MADMADKTYDVIIIGAGVVGSLVARFLSRYRLDVLVLEKILTLARVLLQRTPPLYTLAMIQYREV